MSSPAQQFSEQAEVLTHDLRHREIIQTALSKYEVVRDKSRGAFQDYSSARQGAAFTGASATACGFDHPVRIVRPERS